MIQKKTDHAFGKDIFLLGNDVFGVRYWLEAPRWDCGWYWGFGYIETYSNNLAPGKSRDIESHSHATHFMSEYFTKWNGSNPILAEKTFSDAEGWELSELFKEFYFLKDSAEYWSKGNCNVTGKGLIPKNEALSEEINKIIIPKITARILEILTPSKA